MGHILPLVFSALVCLGILQSGLQVLYTLDSLSKRASQMWQAEYWLRRCVFREAAHKNIDVASRILAAYHPERRAEIEDEGRLLGDDLERLYPEDAEGTVVSEGTCCSPRDLFCFSLYLESHRDQPTLWPNFVPRLSIHPHETER